MQSSVESGAGSGAGSGSGSGRASGAAAGGADVGEAEARGPVRVAWGTVLAAWVTTQLVAGAALLSAASWPFSDLHFSAFTTRWDGAYYLVIADAGYGNWPTADRFPRWAFFPGLSGVIRGLGDLGFDSRIGIHVVNQLALLAALVAVYLLARRRGSATAAGLAVWSLALFPAAFSYSMTYPSALFLAAGAWAFLLAEDHHDLGAAVLAAGAALVRPNGLVVAIALVFALRSFRRIVVVCGPSVVALIAWCVYCADRTGDALVWVTAKSRWTEITLVDALTGGAKWTLVPHLGLGLFAAGLVFVQRRRLPVSWLVFTGLVVVTPLATGMVGMARYAGECFCVFVAGGQVLERFGTRIRVLVLALSAGGLFVYAFVVGRYGLVP